MVPKVVPLLHLVFVASFLRLKCKFLTKRTMSVITLPLSPAVAESRLVHTLLLQFRFRSHLSTASARRGDESLNEPVPSHSLHLAQCAAPKAIPLKWTALIKGRLRGAVQGAEWKWGLHGHSQRTCGMKDKRQRVIHGKKAWKEQNLNALITQRHHI